MQGTASVLRRLDAIKDAITNEVPKKMDEHVRELANDAQDKYSKAQYHGDNDVVVYTEHEGSEYRIIASGSSLLFIEYGTGYHYPHDNPIEDPKNDPGSWSLGPQGKGFLGGYKFLKYKGFWPIPGLDKGQSWVDGNPSANIFYDLGKYVEWYTTPIVTATVKGALR